MLKTWIVVLAVTASACADAAAPPMQVALTVARRDLGRWDQIIAADGKDALVLRRSDSLYSLSMTTTAAPRKLASAPEFKSARIVRAATVGDRHWLFMQTADTAPFAFDTATRRFARFKISEVRVPGSLAPRIQGCSIVRHAGAAIVMVEGGDKATWPRKGNRPLYFWMSLRSGRVRRMPTGWDLDCFSADRSVAVFQTPSIERHKRRPRQALDLASGALVDAIPDWHTQGCIHFSWPDADRPLHPVYTKRPRTSDEIYAGGLSRDGKVYPFTRLNKNSYFERIAARGAFAAFCSRLSGQSRQPADLWLMHLEKPAAARVVARSVLSFSLLDNGHCIYRVAGAAFFRNHDSGAVFDVLKGERRLPPLAPNIARQSGFTDDMRIAISVGVGRGPALALCRFTHDRGYFGLRINDRSPLERTTWRRSILVTSNGRRYRTGLFCEGDSPRRVWLHNSGRVLVETDESALHEFELRLPR